MDGEAITESVTGDAATFAATMFYRNKGDMETDVLEHDGSVVLASSNKMNGTHDVWRAMYECHSNEDTLVLFVSPHVPSARGVMLLIEDEMDRCPFPQDVWGVERTTDYEIEFSNGSKIKSVHTSDSMGADRLRGYHPDLVVVDNWTEEGHSVSEDAITQVIVPMLGSADADLWVNDTNIDPNETLIDVAFDMGAYVKHMDR